MDGAVKVVIQLSEGEEARMAQALNTAANLTRYYAERGFALVIEVVCFGPGVMLLRADRSPLAARVAELAGRPVHFSACANTLQGLAQTEGAVPPLVPQARVVPSGAAHVIELQRVGYAYLRP